MQTGTIQNLIGTDPRDVSSAFPDGFDFEQNGEHTNPLPLRFWEIDCFFKCPVVGTCLDIGEQKQIFKKAGISLKRKDLFQIHEIVVECSANENIISRKVDLRLRHKFKTEIAAFFHMEKDEFMQLWKTRFKEGEFEGIFWVAATRPDLSPEDRRTIFGDIHMEMHLGAKRHREAMQAFASQEEKNQELTVRFREASRERRTFNRENGRLKNELARLRDKYSSLEKDNLKLENESSDLVHYPVIARLEKENQELQSRMQGLSRDTSGYQQQLNVLQGRNRQLELKLEEQREMDGRLRDEIEEIIIQFSSMNRCDETCPSFSLCRKRILIVGGMTKMETFYRKLIEESGGIFEYHDGYTRGGIRDLEGCVRRADMVFCPVDCNSHSACSVSKRLGKKYNRPVKMLHGSSLGAISRAIQEYCEMESLQ